MDSFGDIIPMTMDDQNIIDRRLMDYIFFLKFIFGIFVDDMDHYVCEFGIKLSTCTLNQFLTHLLLRNRFTVASV